MGGQAGIRGYLLQGIIAVLDSLDINNQWLTVSVEPNDESEKVDIIWDYGNGKRKVVQVKSTKNKFKLSDAKKWAQDLKDGSSNKDDCELYLIGDLDSALYKKKNESLNGSVIRHSDLDIDSLLDIVVGKIDEFFETKGKTAVTIGVRKLIAYNLNFQVAKDSIFGKVHNRSSFDSSLLAYLTTIENQVRTNPLATLIEPSTDTGQIQNHLGNNIMTLFGWLKPNRDEIVKEYDDRLGREVDYSVDFVAQYESKLKDDETDILYVHSRLVPRYPDNPKHIIQDHAKSISLVRDKLRYHEKASPSNEHAILFVLSGAEEERGVGYVATMKNHYKPAYLDDELTYYAVDNLKLDFLVASVSTARDYRPELPVKFLYPITEDNSSEKKIGKRGISLPPQYVNTSVLPIIKEDSEKLSVLVFCRDGFTREVLKKVVWLLIRLTTGLANEYRLYFPDFTSAQTNEVNEVLRLYSNDQLLQKVTVHPLPVADSKGLAEIGSSHLTASNDEFQYDENKVVKKAIEINQHLSEYLPYGDQLRPFLSSDMIDSTDLRHFLSSKGVVFKTQNKQKIISTMASMLFSPEEIQTLVDDVSVKERPIDTQSDYYHVITNQDLKSLIPKLNNAVASISDEKLSATILSDKIEFKADKNDPRKYVAEIMIEEVNPTKQAMVSSTISTARISLDIVNGELEIEKGGNSRPSKVVASRVVKAVSETLVSDGDIEEKVRQVFFQDFTNSERVNFLLSFTNIGSSSTFTKQDITLVRYAIDESKDIPQEYQDMAGKNLEISSKGKNLAGLKELSVQKFKEIVFIDLFSVSYRFNVKGVEGYFNVNLNFSNALKDKSNPEGVFQFNVKPYVFPTHRDKVVSNKKLEDELRKAFNTLKREKFSQFNLL